MSEHDFYEGADYAVKCGALTDTEAFNAVCDDLAKAHTEIERLRLIINTIHPQMQLQIDALTAERDDWVEQARKAMEDAEAREAAARREGIEAAAKEVDCGCDIRDAVLERLEAQGQKRASWLCQHGDVCCALQAAEIRTLKWESER